MDGGIGLTIWFGSWVREKFWDEVMRRLIDWLLLCFTVVFLCVSSVLSLIFVSELISFSGTRRSRYHSLVRIWIDSLTSVHES